MRTEDKGTFPDKEIYIPCYKGETELKKKVIKINCKGKKQDDVIPEQVKAITKTGDLWELGKHRVLCGVKHHDNRRIFMDWKSNEK